MRLIVIASILIPMTSGSAILSKEYRPPPIEEDSQVVTLTTYTTDVKQTDSNPLETASGFVVSKRNPKQHRIIAISRDLLKKYRFSDSVVISNAGKYDGVYCVHDVMNKRFTNKIDILVNPKDKGTLLSNVKIKRR